MSTISRRWRAGLTAAIGGTVLTVTVLVAPGSGLAAPGLPATAGAVDHGGDPQQTIARAYLTAYPDLTPEAAAAAATAQAAGAALKAGVAAHWETFGGGWFDVHTATYHLAVTSPETGQVLAAVGQAQGVRVETPLVERSLDALTADAAALRDSDSPLARAAGGRVGVDVTTNQVVALVAPARVPDLVARAPDGVAVVPAEAPAVEADVCNNRLDCDDFLASGLAIHRGNPASFCSLGFTARNPAGQRLALTAGHCSTNVGEQWFIGQTVIRPIGPVSGRIDVGPADATRILVTNPFFAASSAGRIYVGPGNVTVPVTGKNFLLVGDVVCLSAATNGVGNPCGVVTSTADPAVRNMVRIQGHDPCPGDSGGGWYWLPGNGTRWATALHSRSTPGCGAAAATAWASPLTAFFADLTYETS